MKKVTKIETYDGLIHDTVKDAKKHLDKVYGDKLLNIGRSLAYQNYTFVTDYLDKHLDVLVELKQIRDDLNLDADDDESDSD